MTASIYVAFSNGSEDPDMHDAITLGPFDPSYIELTYGTLRVAPDGDHIADLAEDGFWHIVVGSETVNEGETIRNCGQWHQPILSDTRYSDIDMYWKESDS